MTGYGRGEATSGLVTVVVELKSVNNRFRDLQLRVPREYMALEPKIQAILKSAVQRGRVEVHIRRSASVAATQVVSNPALANDYANVINEIAEEMVGFVGRDVPFTFILQQPGVLAVSEARVDVMREWEVVETAIGVAVDDLIQMRKQEGSAIEEEFRRFLSEIRVLVAEVADVSKGVAERLEAKLEGRLRRLLSERYDTNRILQEVALLAEKADINEELSRLTSHCDQFEKALDKSVPVGRRLDFVLQEMNREVNTIGSKACEHPISNSVVDLKAILERLREQAANIE